MSEIETTSGIHPTSGDAPKDPGRARFAVGDFVQHRGMGRGRVVGYDPDDRYVILFPGGEVRHVAYTFEGLDAVETFRGDVELSRIRQAVEEVMKDNGWLDIELEIGKRWTGGTMTLAPGKDGQSKDIPIEMFFKKIIGVREKLRVLEQKINAHAVLSNEDKIELQGYITRAYGSLTSFNILFANKESYFKGQSGKD